MVVRCRGANRQTRARGSAQAAGRSARSSDVTVGSSGLQMSRPCARRKTSSSVAPGPTARLELGRGADDRDDCPRCMIATRSHSASASSMWWVVSRIVVPSPLAELADPCPRRRRGRSGRARRSARPGTAPSGGGASPGRARAAGSSRPSTSGRCVSATRSEPMNASAWSIRVARSARGRWYSLADSTRFSRPVSAPSADSELGHVADAPADEPGLAGRCRSRPPGRAGARWQERDQHLDRRGLAGAVRAEQPEDLAVDGEVEPVDRHHVVEPAGQLVGADRRCRSHGRPPSSRASPASSSSADDSLRQLGGRQRCQAGGEPRPDEEMRPPDVLGPGRGQPQLDPPSLAGSVARSTRSARTSRSTRPDAAGRVSPRWSASAERPDPGRRRKNRRARSCGTVRVPDPAVRISAPDPAHRPRDDLEDPVDDGVNVRRSSPPPRPAPMVSSWNCSWHEVYRSVRSCPLDPIASGARHCGCRRRHPRKSRPARRYHPLDDRRGDDPVHGRRRAGPIASSGPCPPGAPRRAPGFRGSSSARSLRTIVVRRGEDDYVFVLVPGGRRFDWPKLRAHLGVSRLSLPDADEARAATGYERGAITPFGATRGLAGHRRRVDPRPGPSSRSAAAPAASTSTSRRPTSSAHLDAASPTSANPTASPAAAG